MFRRLTVVTFKRQVDIFMFSKGSSWPNRSLFLFRITTLVTAESIMAETGKLVITVAGMHTIKVISFLTVACDKYKKEGSTQ